MNEKQSAVTKEENSQNRFTAFETMRTNWENYSSFELSGQENIILYQKNRVTLRYLKMDEENIYLKIENDYGKSLLFESDGTAVNGVMLNLTILKRIPSGKSAEIAIHWKEQTGFERVDEIIFNIFYSEDGNGIPLDVSDLIFMKRKSSKSMIQLPEKYIYHKKNVKIFYSGMKSSDDYKAEASIIVQNHSKNIISYSIYDGMLNGRKAEWYGEGIVFPHCIAKGWVGTDDAKFEEIKTAVFDVIINQPHTEERLSGTNTSEIQVEKDE